VSGAVDRRGISLTKQVGPNSKTVGFIVHCFKILEKKIKVSKKYVKKLDQILRLLVKKFFIKPSRLDW
jgi:hypothetical protein